MKKIALIILFLAVASAARADEGSKVVPIQVKGDTVEYFHEDQRAVGTGNVSIDYEDVKLTADKITVYMASKEAVAEGHVKLVQQGSVFTGERAEYNFAKKVGQVSRMTAHIDPNFEGKAEKVEKVSDGHFRTVDGYVTTCCGDTPFYRIQAHELDVFPGEKVEARNALLYIYNVPILFIPYFVVYNVDFDRFPVQLIPGKNSDWGAFLLSKWRYHLVNQPDLKSKGNILVDWRERRGFGFGAENFYNGERVGRGAVRGYYINDDNPPSGVKPDRYRGQWRHQGKIGPSTTFTAEVNKLSDPEIIKDFFLREEYERDVLPDNYISIITAKPEYTFSVLARERLNDFFTVVERSPEVRFDTHQRRFNETPFYLRQEVQYSTLKKAFADSDFDQDAIRLDTNHTLTYAGRIGALSVVPHAGTRQTFYSRDFTGRRRDFVRGVFDAGADLSVRFFKTYDIYIDAWGLDYNQIRHIFNPTVSYNYRPNPTISRTELQPFDEIDDIDKQNFIRFNFENKLQTKHKTGREGEFRTREISRVVPFTDFDFDTGRLENVGIDAEWRPYDWMGIETDALYSTRTDKVETANFDVYFHRNDMRVAVGQRYVQDESSQTTLGFDWTIQPGLALRLYERFEWNESESEEFEVTVSKELFNCLIVDFTYNHRPDEDSYHAAFRLKSFTTSSFDLNQAYSRPKARPGRLY